MTQELEHRVGQARDGHRGAVEWLLQSEQQRIFAIAYHMLGRRDEAEEAAQEALLRIFTRLSQLRDLSTFRAWSARLTGNLCRDRLRRSQRPAEPLERAEGMVGHDDAFERSELQGELGRALRALTPVLRLPVLLRDVEGLSYEEVAEVLEIPVGTVKSRLHEARRKLRELLTRQGVTHG